MYKQFQLHWPLGVETRPRASDKSVWFPGLLSFLFGKFEIVLEVAHSMDPSKSLCKKQRARDQIPFFRNVRVRFPNRARRDLPDYGRHYLVFEALAQAQSKSFLFDLSSRKLVPNLRSLPYDREKFEAQFAFEV